MVIGLFIEFIGKGDGFGGNFGEVAAFKADFPEPFCDLVIGDFKEVGIEREVGIQGCTQLPHLEKDLLHDLFRIGFGFKQS